jgi:hypothetical protein
LGLPDLHEIAPTSQGFERVQVPPAVHETQLPPLQTMSISHDVPSGAAFPVSWQDIVPVWQLMVPVSQGLAGVQLPPLVQEVHVPPLHTLFVPHDVPSAAFPATTQTEAPGEQDVTPVLHGLSGWQVVPAVQAPQVPLSHTLLVPQEVPFATFPDCMQTGAPLLQTVVPVRQGALEIVQLAPAWQLRQIPVVPQTMFIPQLVPAETSLPPSLQTGVPVPQASVPW